MKIKTIVINKIIRMELINIYDYIKIDSKSRAQKLVDNLLKEIEVLYLFPKKGKQIYELNNENYRELLIDNYRVLYKIEKEIIYILGIIHSSKHFTLDKFERK